MKQWQRDNVACPRLVRSTLEKVLEHGKDPELEKIKSVVLMHVHDMIVSDLTQPDKAPMYQVTVYTFFSRFKKAVNTYGHLDKPIFQLLYRVIDTDILNKRPVPPSPEARAKMMQPADIAACVWLAVSLPPRAVIEELLVRPL
jgi:hypothetical protein